MERKIGETFEYEGKKLRVEADKDSECKRCCLNESCPDINQKIIGECVNIHRQDKTSVVFVEINDEHPQEKYEPKKERFDPKTLKAFDKVLVNNENNTWQVELFSHMCQYGPNNWYYQCAGDYYYRCLPYNDDTKYLLGTKKEAPEFYKYWED